MTLAESTAPRVGQQQGNGFLDFRSLFFARPPAHVVVWWGEGFRQQQEPLALKPATMIAVAAGPGARAPGLFELRIAQITRIARITPKSPNRSESRCAQ